MYRKQEKKGNQEGVRLSRHYNSAFMDLTFVCGNILESDGDWFGKGGGSCHVFLSYGF